MAALRHVNLRGEGGYIDVYHDSYDEYDDHLHIVSRKLRKGFLSSTTEVSSVFEPVAELEEWPDIWAAVNAVWANRGTYSTTADLVAAMDAALSAAGYTGPGGAAL